jgi:hypothetical protein
MERASRLLDSKLGLDGDDRGIGNFIALVTIPPRRFNAMKQCSVVLYLPSSLPLSKIESVDTPYYHTMSNYMYWSLTSEKICDRLG